MPPVEPVTPCLTLRRVLADLSQQLEWYDQGVGSWAELLAAHREWVEEFDRIDVVDGRPSFPVFRGRDIRRAIVDMPPLFPDQEPRQ
jgi:hypothetical protein